MGVTTVTSEGYIPLADGGFLLDAEGNKEVIWDMPLHKIAHDLGLMNFIYYMCIKTGFIPPIIFMGVGALTDFGPMLRNLRLSIFGAGAQYVVAYYQIYHEEGGKATPSLYLHKLQYHYGDCRHRYAREHHLVQCPLGAVSV